MIAAEGFNSIHPGITIAEWFLSDDATTDLQFYEYDNLEGFLAEIIDWTLEGVKILIIADGELFDSLHKVIDSLIKAGYLNNKFINYKIAKPFYEGLYRFYRMPQLFTKTTGIQYEISSFKRDLAGLVIYYNYQSALFAYEQIEDKWR